MRRPGRVVAASIVVVLASAFAVGPLVRVASPGLAVDMAWYRRGELVPMQMDSGPNAPLSRVPDRYGGRVFMEHEGRDPWGRPWEQLTLHSSSPMDEDAVIDGVHVGPWTSVDMTGGAVVYTVYECPYSFGPDGVDARGLGDDLQPGLTTLPMLLLAHAREALLLTAGLLLWCVPWLRLPRATTPARRLGQLALVAGPPLATLPWLVPQAPDLSAHLPAFMAAPWRVTVGVTLAAVVLLLSVATRLAAPRPA